MRKFTQAVAMECTKERYEADLRDNMLEMGYDEMHVGEWYQETIVVNNLNGRLGYSATILSIDRATHSRHFIDHYNPELFLAIAAMSDSGVPLIGMHWMCIEDVPKGPFHRPPYIAGKIYKSEIHHAITDFFGTKGHSWGIDGLVAIKEYFRPATIEELVNHYTKQAFDPNNWYVVVTEENREMVKEYGHLYLLPNIGSRFQCGGEMNRESTKEITTAQFIEHVYCKLEKSEPEPITPNTADPATSPLPVKTTTVYDMAGRNIAFRPDDIRIGGIQFSVAELQQIINIHNQEFPPLADPYDLDVPGKD